MQILPIFFPLLITSLHAIPRGRRAVRNRNEGDINSLVGVGQYLYQGDIAVVKSRARRAVIRQKHKKWKLPMPYSFDRNFPSRSRQRVLEAMQFWSEKTCVTFHENRYVYPHVSIFEGNGCWSFVGKQPSLREQSLSLERSCTDHTFVVAHEIAHTLGFYHEHARGDRDQFISIDYSNVNPNLTFAFAKESEKQLDHQEAAYEYGSVMHYSVDQFAVNTNRPVIYARDQKFAQAMGNRMRATFQDVSRMNVLYNCHERCANTLNRCQQGGYPAPSDCSQCVCPDGFGGNFCETIEAHSVGQKDNSDCGGVLWASETSQTFYGAVRTRVHSNSVLPTPEHCFWHIRASQGKSIEIQIKNIISPCSMSCSFNALELKLSNFTMTGPRFCCDEHIYNRYSQPKVFQSEGPLAVIGAYARYDYLDFNIEYRAV
ncbi:Zinc metalloproteinase nas-27 [Caenorhabditis elegans]|uniref:Zinc metalloproteinase nas-27 n=1 Tax=Caenorhabditis elegans TaxID=6239 RepID=NAS27_CAEEL|nr:Zinc metalloproteinase nas-27 [Caenorhabditis elegans]O17264.2 RecName: Full=Zinc metalloproteinase nas-27; AltName: Full=Nematode astacin 27; Flags: Precursor [Caenorhabditis elegans]CCD73622.1 Zinc metalloproteinase nas-27 [Caenorhabditis elegans]|eukprot:NP_493926.2 Zinc metalloproteinase nas-27 [Caenorhabditis elegans]